ncbi:MAG: molybdenum transporter, periplasmic molybdate-binding protein [Nevskia sp.]|nr:molybdenum transporter, periplasmic molybdate-binding protein [Nevskia sp.]
MRRLTILLLATLCCAGSAFAAAAPTTLTVAAAANLADVIEVLDAAFMQQTPDAVVKVSTGSSGNFYAQIKNGAPFDVFVSADMDFPRKLIADGEAQSDSLLLYAVGRLALWSTNPAVDVSSGLLCLSTPAVKRISIANTDTAPYGRAAKATLQSTGLWDKLQSKVVTGENISQAAQFVQTGNADAGFVAYSTLKSPKLAGVGQFWLVPLSAHPPLEQGAVITKHGKDNPLSAKYLAFLKSADAQTIFSQYGYSKSEAAQH